ncbi:hypothetical protein ACIA8R_33415 [Nonomuraea sp. NPDC051191]|uniref:hypothetical protein n=1 Tax=Nonomuraea sp. NPDC051191 TaxID=3364372 RepID=UPI00379E6D12
MSWGLTAVVVAAALSTAVSSPAYAASSTCSTPQKPDNTYGSCTTGTLAATNGWISWQASPYMTGELWDVDLNVKVGPTYTCGGTTCGAVTRGLTNRYRLKITHLVPLQSGWGKISNS